MISTVQKGRRLSRKQFNIMHLAGILVLSISLGACTTVTSIQTGIKTGATATIDTIKTGTVKTLDKISVKTGIGNNPRDPLEGFNRVMFGFNEQVDEIVLKPLAQGYQAVVPSFVQTAIGNFFGNIGDVWTAVNDLLQGKVTDGVNDIMRVAVNSTFGLGGLIDIASAGGIPKHREDFGQTLGNWGMRSGPYVVLPVLGASTLRDVLATPLDFKGDLWSYQTPLATRYFGNAVRVIDKRASFLDASSLIEEAALDKYVFIRDAYLQRRAAQVNPDED
jgi:phospholipid-binding lipoprotein MlaA